MSAYDIVTRGLLGLGLLLVVAALLSGAREVALLGVACWAGAAAAFAGRAGPRRPHRH